MKHGRQTIMNWLFEDEYAFKVKIIGENKVVYSSWYIIYPSCEVWNMWFMNQYIMACNSHGILLGPCSATLILIGLAISTLDIQQLDLLFILAVI